MPRHPPCALKNLATKMLASTMQISNNKQRPCQIHHQTPILTPARGAMSRCEGRPVPQTRNNGAHTAINIAAQASQPPPDGGGCDLVRFLRTQQCVRTHLDP